MTFVKLILGLLGLSISFGAQADSGFVGNWKAIRSECQSGETKNSLGLATATAGTNPFKGFQIQKISLSETNINFSIETHQKGDAAIPEKTLVQIELALFALQVLPDSTEKDRTVSEFQQGRDELIREIQKLQRGSACQTQWSGLFSAEGSRIETKANFVSSSCDKKIEGNFILYVEHELKEGRLRLTTPAEGGADGICPKGDRNVTFFERI